MLKIQHHSFGILTKLMVLSFFYFLAFNVADSPSFVCTRAQHHSLSSSMSLRAASRAGVARVCAQVRRAYARKRSARCSVLMHAILHTRGARCRHAILEHASPVLGSGLPVDKIGQAGDPGIVTRAMPGRPGRGPGRGAPISHGRGALVSAPANRDGFRQQ